MRIIADENQPLVREAFAAFGEVQVLPTAAITKAQLENAEVLIARSTLRIDEKLLADTAVKFVGTCTIGFDHVAVDYLQRKNIAFAAAAGCNANSVGEYLTAALLTYANEQNGDLRGKTLGIIGVGNVGKNVAAKARALSMNVLLNDPPRARREGGFTDLATLLRESDFVTLHVPLVQIGADATLQMANADFFAQMKTGAVFINAARGKVVDEAALINALNGGKIAAAILDVFAHEPQIAPSLVEKLFIATPHIAGYSYNGKVNGTAQIFAALAQYLGHHKTWDPTPFLPEPAISKIEIFSSAELMIELHDVVRAIYDIRADAARFRAAPQNFTQLRHNYPQRCEFPQTQIVVERPDLRAALSGLGFTLNPSE